MIASKRNRVCHYCGQKKPTTWDHIVPRSIGGANGLVNRVRACIDCNAAKADRWPTHPCKVCERARRRFAEQHPERAAPYLATVRSAAGGVDASSARGGSSPQSARDARARTKATAAARAQPSKAAGTIQAGK